VHGVTSDIQTQLNTVGTSKANLASPTFTGTVSGIDKTMVGLPNVDNTSDANKPVSTAQQTALDLKQRLSGKDATGGYAGLTLFNINFKNVLNTFTSFFTNSNTAARTYAFPDKDITVAGLDDITGTNSGINTGDSAVNSLYSGLITNATHTGDVTGSNELTIASKAVTLAKMNDMATASLIYRKTAGVGAPEVNSLETLKTDLTLVKSDVGLGNVNNTSDANKPISTAQQAALDFKVDITSITPVAFGGTGLTALGPAGYVLATNAGVTAMEWIAPASGGGGGGTGSVTSVSCSGGTTGLTLAGGPITTTGTFTLGGLLVSANGGTGNGFAKFTGPTTAEKTFTLPDANATLLYSGGALGTPVSGNASNLTNFPTLNQNTSGTAAGLSTPLVVASGGTGLTALGTSAQVLRTNVAGTAMEWATASSGSSIGYSTYDARNDLRALTPTAHALIVVESLGLFQWFSGSTEPDDDETSFATASGVWQLIAAHTDMVFANWLAEVDSLYSAVDTLTAFTGKFLRGSFNMTLTSLGAISTTVFTAPVAGASIGDSVIVNPGNGFGNDDGSKAILNYKAYVSSANIVTINVCNSATAAYVANITPSTWSVLVIKQ
jgi:hypothetical protein